MITFYYSRPIQYYSPVGRRLSALLPLGQTIFGPIEWIGRRGHVKWFPRFPDLTPLDSFYGGT